MADPIRDALERAARELELVAGSLTQAGWAAAASRARNEAHAARAALDAQPLTTRLALHPDGTPQVSIGPAVDIATVGGLAAQPPASDSRQLNLARLPIFTEYVDTKSKLEQQYLEAPPPAPTPASDGEREALAVWLDGEAQSCAIQFKDRIPRAATLLRQSAPAAVPAELVDTRYYHPASGATIERTRTEPDAWAVRRGSERLSVSGEWSIEPSPSERRTEYLAQHSFSSPHAALAVLQQQKPSQGGEVEQ
jgi:hypothetical protein